MRHSVSPLQKVLEWPRSDAYILKKRWHLYKIWAEVLALCAQPVRRHREFRYRCVSSHIFGRKQTLSSSKNSVSRYLPHNSCLAVSPSLCLTDPAVRIMIGQQSLSASHCNDRAKCTHTFDTDTHIHTVPCEWKEVKEDLCHNKLYSICAHGSLCFTPAASLEAA